MSIGDADEFHILHIRENAGMFLAEMADADYSQF
jgi:hypothetical protein